MKKSNKEVHKSRIDLSVDIKYIDNDIDTIITLSIPQGIHSSMTTSIPYEGEQLVQYIAETLEDTKEAAMRTHRKYVSKYRAEVLLEILAYVLAKPDKEIDTSRARYYNWLVKNYEKTGSIPRH